jgi:hypothetical protein
MKKNILVAIVLFLMTSQFSYSQFIYIDIIPDRTISINGGIYNLDLNSDGILDFQIKLAKTAFPDTMNNVRISDLTDSCFIASYTLDGCGDLAKAFDIDDVVSNYTDWSHIATVGNYTLISSTCMSTGSFSGQTNKYIGVKMIKNGTTFYGWVGIDIASHATWFKMKDYACNIYSINAGLTVGIPTFRIKGRGDNLLLYPNPTNDNITIDCGSNFSTLNSYTIKITNSLSQTVYTSLVNQQITTINLSTWTGRGIYFVHLIDATNNAIDIKKIVLQ